MDIFTRLSQVERAIAGNNASDHVFGVQIDFAGPRIHVEIEFFIGLCRKFEEIPAKTILAGGDHHLTINVDGITWASVRLVDKPEPVLLA